MDGKVIKVRLPVVVGENVEQVFLEDVLVLDPLPLQVRDVKGEVVSLNSRLIPGRIVMEGVVALQLYFVGEDKTVYHQAEQFPFWSSLAITGAQPNMDVEVHCTVPHVFYQLGQDGLHLTMVVEVFGLVSELTELELLPGGDRLVTVEQKVLEGKCQELVVVDLSFEHLVDTVSSIEDSWRESHVTVSRDRVHLAGFIDQHIYYSDQQGVERYKISGSQFSSCLDLPGVQEGMGVEVECFIEEFSLEIAESGRGVQRKLAVSFLVTLFNPIQLQVGKDGDTLVSLQRIVGERDKKMMTYTSINLNQPGKKIRKSNHQMVSLSSYVLKDKLVVEGSGRSEVFYIGMNGIEQYVDHIWDFSGFLDFPGADRGMRGQVEVDVVFGDFVFDEGGKVVTQRALLEVTGKVIEPVQMLVKTNKPRELNKNP